MTRRRDRSSEPLWGDGVDFGSPEALVTPEPHAPPERPQRSDPPADETPPPSERTVTPGAEPPDWALPAWDAVDATPERRAARQLADAARQRVPQSREREFVAAADGGPHQPPREMALRILQVSDVTRAIRDAIRREDDLRDTWVEGEVGRVTVSSAGHAYFTLKDDRSQLSCVFFRDDRVGSPFEPRTGLRVVVHGRVDVFETQGVYQLYVSSIQPAGFGDLALRFEALKAKLAAEGLFDTARKRQLPQRPAVIGVVSSPSGAVWHDICHVLARRWPLARVLISPCRVQGDGAAPSVVAALDRLARYRRRCEAQGRLDEAPAVVILARGGGSLEDLWPFNDERLVRAVVAHPVPVVSGVGHEVDVTLADFAADVRAPTPSAAAELVVPDRAEFAAGLADLERRARGHALATVAASRRELVAERRALDRLHPGAQLAQARERAGLLLDRATRAVSGQVAGRRQTESRLEARLRPLADARLARARAGLERSGASLAALGPQATLDRGYAIVRRRTDSRIVRDPSDAPAGERLVLRVARGDLPAVAEERSDEPAEGGGG